MNGAVPPLFSYNFIACYVIKHRDNFTFTFAPYIMLGSTIINMKHFIFRQLVLIPVPKRMVSCVARNGTTSSVERVVM